MVYDVSEQQLAALTAAYPVNVAENNIQIARECEFIILAIKPIYMRGVLEEIQKYCYNKKIISHRRRMVHGHADGDSRT